MQQNLVFRPRNNLVWGGAALLLDGMFLVQTLFYPRGSNLLVDIPAAVALGTAAALLWIKPKLVLRDEDLVVVNPLSSITIRYGDIEHLDSKWALLIHHSGRRTRVWVATASGKRRWIGDTAHRWNSDRLPKSETGKVEYTTVSRSTDSDSGLAASLIEDRLRKLH